MTVTLTADKMLRVMDILQRNPNSLKAVRSALKPDGAPVRMKAFIEVIKSDVPLTYTVAVDGKDHRLHLTEGYADSESPGVPVIAPYNAALKALGNKAVLSEHAPYSEVCAAHTAIYNRVHKGVLPVPDGTEIKKNEFPVCPEHGTTECDHTAAPAAPTSEETKPVQVKEPKVAVQRPYVWVKNGKEERITAKQWEQRVRMCGGVNNVPLGCGQLEPLIEDVVLLSDTEDIDIEWDQDIPYVVEEPNETPAAAETPVLVQRPVADAPAKRKKKNKKKAAKQQPVQTEPVMDLARALSILGA